MVEPQIRVSVIVPAYNAERTVAAAVQSALQQTETSLEVLVIDDASTDRTVDVVAALAAQDKRVRLLRQRPNRGPAAARNRGLVQARGAWIAVLDADDGFAPDRLATLLTLAEQTGADIVSDNPLLCEAQGSTEGTPMLAPAVLPEARWLSPAEFVSGNIGSRFTPRISYGFLKPLMRRTFLRGNGLQYDERNRFGEDFLFALSCLLRGARWWLTPVALYRYTVRFGTLTDVQSADDLLRIRRTEEALLDDSSLVAADPALADALRRHKAVIEHFYYYRAFTDALKARTFSSALNVLLESRSGFCHIVTEGAMQAPRVTLKALRGGFRQPPPTAALRGPRADGAIG